MAEVFPDLSQYEVLIVDDVPLNQLLVEKMLSRYRFRIRKAGNGLEAMREIIARKPSLVLLDLKMPVMDGYEVLRTLQADERFAQTLPVIVLSALNTHEDILRAYALGAKDFITKPITYDRLVQSVHAQLPLRPAER